MIWLFLITIIKIRAFIFYNNSFCVKNSNFSIILGLVDYLKMNY